MNEKPTDPKTEQSLVKLYMDLMSTNESGARCVFMYACPEPDQPASSPPSGGVVLKPAPQDEAAPPPPTQPLPGRTASILLALGASLAAAQMSPATTPITATNSFLTRPLSLADAVNIALHQNPNILRAQKDLEAAQGVAVQTRAVAVPKVAVIGSYNAMESTDVDFITSPPTPTSPGFTFGNDQTWSSQVRVIQSLYEGGRVMSSVRAARLTREQSVLNYQTAVSDAVLDVELAYFDVLLAEQQITVQEASVELLNRELTDTTRRFDAGTVPRFNVLRAEVELANAQPPLIRARNTYRISKHNLANLLGLQEPKETAVDMPLKLTGNLEAVPYDQSLARSLQLALQRRTELSSLRKAEALRKEDLVSARAGSKPGLQAYGGYDGHNSILSQDLGVTKYGWIAGVQLTWNLFDGMRTKGRVQQAAALHERSLVDLDDAGRRIELEVRTAHSNFIEADEVLKSQQKVLEEAEEALRLASARSDAGTGTQLDVLSAQTALTQARTTQVQALHAYAAARAKLERAVGMIVPAKGSEP